jgi:hypothetical protein
MHSCTRSSNCDVAKNHKKKTWVKKTSMSTGSATNQKETLSRPHDKEILLKGTRRNYCSHCDLSGHWEKKCWKLHPQLRCNSRKKPTPALTKKEAVKELVINVPTPVFEETQLQKEGTFDWLCKKWLSFLQN